MLSRAPSRQFLTVDPAFPLILTVIVLMGGPDRRARTAAAIAFALIVLVHELGHAIARHLAGAGFTIRLHAFVGVTHSCPEDAQLLGRWIQLGVVLAGPLAGLLTALLAAALTAGGAATTIPQSLATHFAELGLLINLANLLPIAGLDGARIAVSLFVPTHRHLGRARAVGTVSTASASAGVWLAALQGWYLIAALLLFLAIRSLCALLQLGQVDSGMPGVPAAVAHVGEHHRRRDRVALAALVRSLDDGAQDAQRDFARSALVDLLILDRDLDEADREADLIADSDIHDRARARVLLVRSPAEGWRRLAERLGISAAAAGLPDDVALARLATATVAQAPKLPVGDAVFLARVLAVAGRHDIAIVLAEAAWQRGRSPQVAWDLACWFAQRGNGVRSEQWRERAHAAGVDTVAAMEEDWRMASAPAS